MTDQPEAAQPETQPEADDAGLEPLADDGRLTPDQVRLATQWVATHWANRQCPFHGATQWAIDGLAAAVPAGSAFSGKVFSMITLTCGICKYTVFINAVAAGIVKRNPPIILDEPAEVS